jgi:glucosylceramidase
MPTPVRGVLAALVAAAGTLAPSYDEPARPAESAVAAEVRVTSPTDRTRRLHRVRAGRQGAQPARVTVDPGDVRQAWWGTGAALTDAALGLMRGRPETARLLYGTGARSARLALLRLPLSSTDLSRKPWSWSWSDGRSTPPPQARAALRFVRDRLLPRRPGLQVVGSPWSAPPGMKTSGSLRGGALERGSVRAYADLLADQAAWARSHGVPLGALTVANEPGHTSDYPTMRLSTGQQAEVGRRLAPRLGATQLWALDHNWSQRHRLDRVLRTSRRAYDAAAFHCYGGQPRRMAGLRVPRLVTECTGTTDGWAGTFAWDARQLVDRAVAAGSSGLLLWSLALDRHGGPTDRRSQWGCKTCRGLLTVTPKRVRPGPEFYTLAHLSRAAPPGSRVLAARAPRGLAVVAFRQPDGAIGVFVHNGTGGARAVRVDIGATTTREYVVRPGELATVIGR